MKTRHLVYMALFIALGIVLPIGFHMVGAAGPIFLPMHLPVFLAGIMTGPIGGLIVGVITPLLSSLMTGMPPVLPMLPIMLVELGVYGLTIGYLFKNRNLSIYPSLIISMLLGRIGVGIVVWSMVHIFNFAKLPANPTIFVWGSIVKGLPGIAIQLIIVPAILIALKVYNGDLVDIGVNG